MSTLTPEKAIRAYCDAFTRQADGEIEAMFAEDAALDLPLYDHRITGRAEILGELRTAMRGLKDIRVDLHHVIEKGSRGFAEGVFTAEHVGIPPQVDGTPLRLDFKFVAIATLAEGKIVHWTEHFDVKPLKPRERTHLYPITRRSPYWDGTVEAGVSEFMVYNHTYFPLI